MYSRAGRTQEAFSGFAARVLRSPFLRLSSVSYIWYVCMMLRMILYHVCTAVSIWSTLQSYFESTSVRTYIQQLRIICVSIGRRSNRTSNLLSCSYIYAAVVILIVCVFVAVWRVAWTNKNRNERTELPISTMGITKSILSTTSMILLYCCGILSIDDAETRSPPKIATWLVGARPFCLESKMYSEMFIRKYSYS